MDRVGPTKPPATEKVHIPVRLILVRHGQTSSNLGHHLDTAAPGADLTDLGREQAQSLVQALVNEPVSAIYVSNLVRTHQTATPLADARGLSIEIREGLREIGAGELEMANDHDSIETYLESALSWADGYLDSRIPGSDENGHDVMARFDAVVEEAATALAPDRVAVLVSHGAVIRAWCALRCANLERRFTATNGLSNTGVIVLDGEPGAWRVLTWQDQAVGGPALQDPESDGAAAEELDEVDGPAL